MKENFLKCTTFPFAFNPENPASRSAKWIDEKTLVMSFDMTVENAPECAAVALILNGQRPKKVSFEVNTNGNTKPQLYIELKKEENKLKYFEALLSKHESVTLNKKTTEIVFTCWRMLNKNFKGEVTIIFD